MTMLSREAQQHLQGVTSCTAWSPADVQRAPIQLRTFEEALFEATVRRGLPVLAGFSFGHGQALLRDAVPDSPGVPLAWHPRRATLRLADDGRVVVSGPRAPTVAPSLASLVDRLVLADEIARRAYRLVSQRQHAHAFAAELGCKKHPTWGHLWLRSGGEACLIEIWGEHTLLLCAARADAERCFRLAQERGLLLRLEDEMATVAEAPLENEAPEPSSLYEVGPSDRSSWFGSTGLRVFSGERGQLVQRRDGLGGCIDVRIATPGAVLVECPPLARGSSRLHRYLVAHRARQVPRLCAPEELSRWLDAAGARAFGVIAEVEAQLGGLVSAGEWGGPGPVLLGPWFVVTHREALAEAQWGYSVDAQDNPQRLPFVHLAGRDLFHLGIAPELELCADERGWIWSWDPDRQELRPLAETALVALEKLALAWELLGEWAQDVALLIEGDPGEELPESFGARLQEEASDAVSAQYIGERIWIQRHTAIPPKTAETSVVTATLEVMVEAARRARGLCPSAALTLRGSSLDIDLRWKALHDAGLGDVSVAP
ncbi:hypothetical protein [Sorangium sp. So ce385]|uniref:hypothetical protein n=1 Tax=Sorangium sp. So ce385 TaxID=3133308 RepID=UPI003F5B1D9E